MADDVFDHDDGIIDEDADAEDQREERDAVEGEAIQIEHQQSESERGGNGHRHNPRLTPAERQPDQQRDTKDGYAHVQ